MLISMDSIFSEISRLNLKDGKTIEQRLLKLLEELGELSQALLSMSNKKFLPGI